MHSALKAKTHSLATVASPVEDASSNAAQQENAAQVVCPRCYGIGLEVVAGRGARRCECRKQGDRTKLLEAARIPARYRECSLSNYQLTPGNGSQLQAFNYAFKLADKYPAVDRGLFWRARSASARRIYRWRS